MVVQVGPNLWVNPDEVVIVESDPNGFGVVFLRYCADGKSGGWPVEVVVKSINAGGE